MELIKERVIQFTGVYADNFMLSIIGFVVEELNQISTVHTAHCRPLNMCLNKRGVEHSMLMEIIISSHHTRQVLFTFIPQTKVINVET